MKSVTTPGLFDNKRNSMNPHDPIETNLFTDGALEAIIDEG